ncbi:vegetative incompatibility protein HET-E-1 [Elaphomyces granulatus]
MSPLCSQLRKLLDKIDCTKASQQDDSVVSQPRTAITSLNLSTTSSKGFIGTSITRDEISAPPDSAPLMSQTALSTTTPTTGSPPERLWNRAYDELKNDHGQLLLGYEKILSQELDGVDWNTISESQLVETMIEEKNPVERKSQMTRLVWAGLEKTEREANVKKRAGEDIQVVVSTKDMIDSVIKAVPQAALAWTGVCLALQIFLNPIGEMKANREGILHVISRMDWYWNLSALFFKEDTDNNSPAGLREQLRKQVVDLYKELLLYQVKTVCSYYRNRWVTLLRDIIKLDNWDGGLQDVQRAEEGFERDSNVYINQETRSNLQELVKIAKDKEVKLRQELVLLRDINQALQDRVSQEKEKETKDCLQGLYLIDPEAEIDAIENRKDHLFRDSYRWILNSDQYKNFTSWTDNNPHRLLWIKGDAGKGKTMLLIGIIRELSRQLESNSPHLSYFFIQGTDSKSNTTTAVLRCLIWMMLVQNPSLIPHFKTKYDPIGPRYFDHNAFEALSKVFDNMLADPSLSRTYLIVDALDECVNKQELTNLLRLISATAEKSSKVKWLVSSRYRSDIESQLKERARLDLELNAQSISKAVDAYIDHKLSKLDYLDDLRVRAQVADELRKRADGTFLWVALVCKLLESNDNDYDAMEILGEMPSDLKGLYDRMMNQINKLERRDPGFCKHILSIMTLAYRPLRLSELTTLAKLPPKVPTIEIVKKCASFLTLRSDTVYLIHQSAQDYLSRKDVEPEIFPDGCAATHRYMLSRSLDVMEKSLHEDIYNLKDPGCLIDEIKPVNPDPLDQFRYACVYWADHLSEIDQSLHNEIGMCDDGRIDGFLKNHLLHWLEALSLIRNTAAGVIAIMKLENLVAVDGTPNLHAFIHDAKRFILFNRSMIEEAPLQLYYSALAFAPRMSIVRSLYDNQISKWAHRVLPVEKNWSSLEQILTGHSDTVNSVAFSPDGKRVVSGSFDSTVRVWDITTGQADQILTGHSDNVNSVAFSPDGKKVVSGSFDLTVRVWDITTGQADQTLTGHSDKVTSVAFSPDGKKVVYGSEDSTVRVWDITTGQADQTLMGHSAQVNSVAFSPDGKKVVSGSDDWTVRVWDITTGQADQTLMGHSARVNSVAFSPDGKKVVSGSDDWTVRVWDITTGQADQTLTGHSHWVMSVAFSPDGKKVVSGSYDLTVRVWDITTGQADQTLTGHSHSAQVMSVAFSPDGKKVVSGSYDSTVRVWDITTGQADQTLTGHSREVMSVAFSPDGKKVVSGSFDSTVRVWDITTGQADQTLTGHSDMVTSVAFSRDGKKVVSGSDDSTVRVWDITTGQADQTLMGHSDWVVSVAFSPDGKKVVSGSWDRTVRVWDITTRQADQTLTHLGGVTSVAFSPDGKKVVSGSHDRTVRIWDITTGQAEQVGSVALSPDGKVLSSYSYSKPWLNWNGSRILYLPFDVRPYVTAFSDNSFVIGSENGRVTIISYIPQD